MWSVAGRSKQLLLNSTLQRATVSRSIAPTQVAAMDPTVRSFSTGKHKKFSPRRRPAANYRPTQPRGSPYFRRRRDRTDSFEDRHATEIAKALPTQLGTEEDPATGSEDDRYDHDGLSKQFGPELARVIRSMRRQQTVRKGQRETVEDYLRDMDYLAAPEGSTEELAYERRTLSMECDTEEERENYLKDIEKLVEKQQIEDLDLEEFSENYPVENDGPQQDAIDFNDPLSGINPNQKAFGEWGELLIRVDRNIKLWRGGRIQSYRALVIGGNLNGCAGFGTGKSQDPQTAIIAASRKAKRNIFFVDRYQGNSLSRDLAGQSNSCKVVLRATHRGLRGNPLCIEILKYFGITNATAKCVHGRRSQYNVVRATFKALATHESMEDIAFKRGRRIVSVDRGRRLGL